MTIKTGDWVYILDDDKLVRFHLSQVLSAEGYSVRAFGSAAELFEAEAPHHPCCLLLDIQMPGTDGTAVHKQLIRLGWPMPVVFITAHATVPVAVKALQTGALDVITKPVDVAHLVRSVENALHKAREIFHQGQELDELQQRVAQLTDREKEVFAWVITGRLNKEIGAQLRITERTVKAHRASIMEKLSANSVVDLVRVADRVGIRPAA